LITTGLHDARTPPWEPAKLAAALQASGTTRPILLRVDAEAGHGIESTKSQNDALYADMWAFVFWRAGRPEWRPRFFSAGPTKSARELPASDPRAGKH
jgi:prolyl oligopeptidase